MILSWDITQRCNLACKHCLNANQRSNIGNDLTSAEAIRIIRSLPVPPIKTIRLLGGEPFLREDLPLLVAELTRRGVEICITTNGQLANYGVLRSLIEMEVDTIVISIDGDRCSHDKIRGHGSFDKMTKFLKVLQHARNTSTKPLVKAGLILQRDNHHRLGHFFDWLRSHPLISHLHVGQAEPLGRAIEFDVRLTPSEVTHAARWIFVNHKKIPQNISIELPGTLSDQLNREYGVLLSAPKANCGAGAHEARIFSDGRLYPCHLGEQIEERLISTGRIHPDNIHLSLRRHSFASVYNGALFKEFFQYVHEEPSHYKNDHERARCPFADLLTVDSMLGFKPDSANPGGCV